MLWKLELVVRRVGCFFVGHDKKSGEWRMYEPDYCSKCLCDWPQDKVALSLLLNRCFGWLIEREWSWFARFDDWLIEYHNEMLPDWWEY